MTSGGRIDTWRACRRTSTKRATPTAVSAAPSASVPTPTCQRDSAVDQRLLYGVQRPCRFGVVARGVRRDDEADAHADGGHAGAGESQPVRIAPPLGRRWRRRGWLARRLDDDHLRVVGEMLRAAAERDLRRVRLHGVRVGGEEALIERDGALAVARQPLRLTLREQELAPRLDRVAGLEIGDGARVVTGGEALEPARVERRGLGPHRPFHLGWPRSGSGRGGRRRGGGGAGAAAEDAGADGGAAPGPQP